MRLGGRRTVVSDINVTPMADIMIVLLIIFMVAVPKITAPVSDHPRGARQNFSAYVRTSRLVQNGRTTRKSSRLRSFGAQPAMK